MGAALYEPAVGGVLAAQPPELHGRICALQNLALNVGAVLRPAAAALLGRSGPAETLEVGGACLGILGGLHLLLPPGSFPAVPPARRTAANPYGQALAHRAFRILAGLMILWWILYAQLFAAFPVLDTRLGGSDRWASLLFLVNGLTGMGTALLVAHGWAHRPATGLLAWGFAVAALGMGLISLAGPPRWLLACMAVYTVGETLVLTGADVLVAGYAKPETRATFFGLLHVPWAIGGALGNYLGAWLLVERGGPVLWLLPAAVGLIGAAASRILAPRLLPSLPAEEAAPPPAAPALGQTGAPGRPARGQQPSQ